MRNKAVQRPGDWVGFTWGDFDGENLDLSQNKTDRALKLPCSPQLLEALHDAKAALPFTPMPSLPILTNTHGHRLTYSGMAQIMVRERKRLGLMTYDLHGLRYRGVMELAWAGCVVDEIMSYCGHSTKSMVIKYAGAARQIMRAQTANDKRRIWTAL